MVKKTILKNLKNLTLREMRSYGTPTKVSPNQVKIGGTEGGLYYDKDLPFLTQYIQKRNGKKFAKYRLRGRGKKPSDMLDVQSWDPIKKKKVMEKVRRDDPRLSLYSTESGQQIPTLLEFGGQTKREKIAKPFIEKINDAFERSGVGGIFTDVANASMRTLFSDMGGKISAVGGPTGSQIDKLLNIIGSNDESVTAQNVRRLMPYQNIWYLDTLFDQVEKGIQ